MNIIKTIAALSLVLLSNALYAQVQVKEAWIRPSVEGQNATGAFMQLKSMKKRTLVKVSTPQAKTVEIHEMKMDGGMMKMRAIEGLDLPVGKMVELKPGGYHIMMFDLEKPFTKGQKVPLTLKFKEGQKTFSQVVEAEVRGISAK
jgi:periplasmic copper chaperone A